MNSPYRRFCLLLAGANFSPREIKQLADALSKTNVKKLHDDMRRYSGGELSHLRLPAKHTSTDNQKRTSPQSLTDRISAIFSSAGVSSSAAAKYLRDAVAERHSNLVIPEFRGRTLADVVPKLLDLIPSSELLHLAATAKSKRGSTEDIPWPVMNRDD